MMPSFYDVYLHMTYVYMIVYTYIYTIYIYYTQVLKSFSIKILVSIHIKCLSIYKIQGRRCDFSAGRPKADRSHDGFGCSFQRILRKTGRHPNTHQAMFLT